MLKTTKFSCRFEYGHQVSRNQTVEDIEICKSMPCLYLNSTYTLTTLPRIATNLPDEQEVCFNRFQSEQVSSNIIRHLPYNVSTTGPDRIYKNVTPVKELEQNVRYYYLC